MDKRQEQLASLHKRHEERHRRKGLFGRAEPPNRNLDLRNGAFLWLEGGGTPSVVQVLEGQRPQNHG